MLQLNEEKPRKAKGQHSQAFSFQSFNTYFPRLCPHHRFWGAGQGHPAPVSALKEFTFKEER